MKTVIHWKEVGKAFCLVIFAGLLVAMLQLPETIGFIVGMAAGSAAMLFSLSKWDLYHFE